jgi:hypothetical protein
MQRFFGNGYVTVYDKSASYEVVKLNDLASIIEHFDNYPLKTKKYGDFILFKKALDIVSNKEHLTMAGLTKLINIRATLNKGLSERLSAAFTQVIPVPRPVVPSSNLDSNTPGVKH